MGSAIPLSTEELVQIKIYAEKGMTATAIGRLVGRDYRTVQAGLRQLQSTVDLATTIARAQALPMMKRVIADGSVKDHLEILRDEKVGALSGPPSKQTVDNRQQVLVHVGSADRPAMVAPTQAQIEAADAQTS